MLNLKRCDYILKELQKNKAVYVGTLAQKYYVSSTTIRRDLKQLEKGGYLRRTYGGAILSNQDNGETPFAVRKNENHKAKDTIGMLASQLVKDDMIIVFDSSSTVLHMVKYLQPKNNLKVITTSAQVSLSLAEAPKTQLFCTGGWMNTYSGGFYGEAAQYNISGFNTDLMFISAQAISMIDGVSDISEEETTLRQWMMKKCKKIVLLLDSTKFDQVSFKPICEINQIDFLITDKKPSDEWMEVLRSANVTVIYPGCKFK